MSNGPNLNPSNNESSKESPQSQTSNMFSNTCEGGGSSFSSSFAIRIQAASSIEEDLAYDDKLEDAADKIGELTAFVRSPSDPPKLVVHRSEGFYNLGISCPQRSAGSLQEPEPFSGVSFNRGANEDFLVADHVAQDESGETTPTLPGFEEEDQQMVPGASFAAETTLEDFEHRGGSAAQ